MFGSQNAKLESKESFVCNSLVLADMVGIVLILKTLCMPRIILALCEDSLALFGFSADCRLSLFDV